MWSLQCGQHCNNKFVIAVSERGQWSVLYSTVRGCIQKFPDWVDNEINNNKHSLRSNTKDYGGKTH
jgi:hypothetical protein